MNLRLLIGLCAFLLMGSFTSFAQQNIYVNQVGYTPTSPKLFYTDYPADSFDIINCQNEALEYRQIIKLKKENDFNSGLTLYTGDFSEFQTPGQYLIKVYAPLNSGISSYPFNISNSVYSEMIQLANKSLFLQRCGMAMEEPYAGKYTRKICHLDDAHYHPTTGQNGHKDVTGGWHDAGDYGKYIAPGSVTVAILLLAHEMNPEKFSSDACGIPESGNGIPDLLDEVKYELDWLFKMQREDGAVHEKVHSKDYVQFVMPSEGHLERYIYEVSSTATADFAAVMAVAARKFKAINANYSTKCLEAARKAYQFLRNNPDVFPHGGFKNPSDTQAGGYSDAFDKNERIWAASELYITTGEKKFHDDFQSLSAQLNSDFSVLAWNDPSPLAYYSYLLNPLDKSDKGIHQKIKDKLIAFCDHQVKLADQDGFGIAMAPDDFIWGSNGYMLNKAMNLIIGYEMTNNQRYLDLANHHLNYILGVNPLKISYVTGVGTKRILHLHHAPSVADLHVGPIPGILTGGPNRLLEDQSLEKTFTKKTPPAKTFLDNEESYSSNENTIYANASLVFIAGYFNQFVFTSEE